MTPVRNAKLIFNEVPSGYPEPGKTTVYDASGTIDLDSVALNGSVLVKVLYLSADPYMRGKMRDASVQSYSPAFTLGQPITGLGIGKVLKSEKEGINAGEYISLPLIEWAEYTIPPVEILPYHEKIVPAKGVPLSVYLGALGMPGRTAYHAWKEFAHAKQGETAFVTTAAGAVGLFVVQLAKMQGLKVIASVGSSDKAELAKSVGADVVFNYKETSREQMDEILKKEGGVDIYWDNVGGSTLDVALGNANSRARFIECGMISGYNNKNAITMQNLMRIITQRIAINGFIVSDLYPKYNSEFNEIVPKWVLEGKMKYTEDRTQGLEFGGEALLELQIGKNTGKKIVVVAEE
ncbi:NAD-P-binding protein [Dendrothele bispora CBS 962.96]|uniref:NAD-P-binding protein n=1 Tax=Dendrothele bispora (strain CBS 962.96) TaxID=1314807 RepID=A0A4S8L5C6_DENBC|nr:NAD-P-binding protein [Dendrothele bispora CBS 962.96]